MNNVWPYVLMFLGVFIVDIAWTYYLIKVAERHAWSAGIWAGIIYFMNSFITTEYVENHWLIIPAVLGSILGTYTVIKYKLYKQNKQNEKKTNNSSTGTNN